MRAVLAACVLAAGPAAGQETSQVLLDAKYLAAPTDWCPADAGIPMLVAMDGPDIVRGPEDFPRAVKVRRGSDVQVIDGANTASFQRADDLAGPNAEVIGRFVAEFQTCFSPWGVPEATGTWRLSGPDGAELASGLFEGEQFSAPFPFFRPGPVLGETHIAQLGDRFLFAIGDPEITTTQTFLAQPDKE